MNNIEKNFAEVFSEFFYDSSVKETVSNLHDRFKAIVKKGKAQEMTLTKEDEQFLLHNVMLKGVPFILAERLKERLKSFEESVSEAPLLVANPSTIKRQDLLGVFHPNMMPFFPN